MIGIRREDKSRWERRTPVVPADIARLIRDDGMRFVFEPSGRRTYDDASYRAAGAEEDSGLQRADIVLAVKEVPAELIRRERVYAFFAHVIKGQSHNMPLLRRLLDQRATLIEWERVTDDEGRRLVLFGRQAGQAGMIDALWALGQRWAAAGYDTPLAEVEPAHRYEDLASAKLAIAAIGERLAHGAGLPNAPMVVGFTGAGNVSRGAQEIFDLLPHTDVRAEGLAQVATSALDVDDRFVKVRFRKRHLAAPKEGNKEFDAAEYREQPELYRSRFGDFLPHLSVLVNGIFWTPDYPRLITRDEAADMWRRDQRRLELIADITCDLDGAVELTYRATQPDAPTYVYDPLADRFSDGLDGDGIVVLAVDNLPCELPRDASDQFSASLRSLLPGLASADFSRSFAELDLPPPLRRAVITHRGELTPRYRYLNEHL